MGSKALLVLVMFLATILLISAEVAPKDVDEKFEKNDAELDTNGVDETKYFGRGGYGGYGGGRGGYGGYGGGRGGYGGYGGGRGGYGGYGGGRGGYGGYGGGRGGYGGYGGGRGGYGGYGGGRGGYGGGYCPYGC